MKQYVCIHICLLCTINMYTKMYMPVGLYANVCIYIYRERETRCVYLMPELGAHAQIPSFLKLLVCFFGRSDRIVQSAEYGCGKSRQHHCPNQRLDSNQARTVYVIDNHTLYIYIYTHVVPQDDKITLTEP